MSLDAPTFCLLAAGGFFMIGLACGVWKYAWIARTAAHEARAPAYVDIAHRAALMYAFACGLLGELCAGSAWPDPVNLAAAVTLVTLFASAVLGYIAHGALRDTDNQLRRPHVLGTRTIPAGAMTTFMIVLSIGEIAAFGVLLAGFGVARL